ncbi:MAG TPA: AbrB/MazE/SpoVT family DNA-binding domain-containing protein [Candidatus Nanoarchaeia archaeon]|nr:AbrB/MazE/SpoVT family DNA-binding domain-containing protein [Candidatus Nanoarchaeia archaeon]
MAEAPEQFLRTVRRSGTSLAVHIPPEVASLMEIREGDMVRVVLEPIKKRRKG